VLKAITIHNGTQFDAETFKDFCDHWYKNTFCISETSGIKWTGRTSQWNHNNRDNEVNLQSAQRKVARRVDKSGMEPQHCILKVNRIYPVQASVGDEAITPGEARMGSIRSQALAEDEEYCKITKDTIEGTRLQAIDHINKYQVETVRWRDQKVRLKTSN
jgi:hypothetical protein